MKTNAQLARCPLAQFPRHAEPFITYYYDGSQRHHLLSPALWRFIWEPGSPWRGRRLWASWWYLTHRTTHPATATENTP